MISYSSNGNEDNLMKLQYLNLSRDIDKSLFFFQPGPQSGRIEQKKKQTGQNLKETQHMVHV